MRASYLFRFVAVSMCWSVPVAVEGEPSVNELIKLAPVVGSADAKCRRICITGQMKISGFPQAYFRAQYQHPDQFALDVVRLRDHTPFIHLVNGQLYFYDAVNTHVVYLSRIGFRYKLFSDISHNNKLCLEFRLQESGESEILFDFKALHTGNATKSEIAKVDARSIRLTQSFANGTSLMSLIDPSRKCPIKQFNFKPANDGLRPIFLELYEVAVNEDVFQPWPTFPSRDRLGDKIPIVDLSSQFLGPKAIEKVLKECMYSNLAIEDLSRRDAYRAEEGASMSWDVIEENDRTVSRGVREIIKVPFAPERKSN